MEEERELSRNYNPVKSESTFEMDNANTNIRVDVPSLDLPPLNQQDQPSPGGAETNKPSHSSESTDSKDS